MAGSFLSHSHCWAPAVECSLGIRGNALYPTFEHLHVKWGQRGKQSLMKTKQGRPRWERPEEEE